MSGKTDNNIILTGGNIMKFQKVRKSVALILAVLTLAGGTVAALPSITTESLAAYGMEMPALENNSTISSTSTNQGVAVTLYANAAGGTGTYSYGFFYKKKTSLRVLIWMLRHTPCTAKKVIAIYARKKNVVV